MTLYLERRGVYARILQQRRAPSVAHRWSTADHIVSGDILLGALRSLEDGRDRDGNQWYRSEWDPGGRGGEAANASPALTENAVRLGNRRMSYAEEGYEPNDSRRRPNGPNVPVSKHVYGLAIDCRVDWDATGGPWSDASRALIENFGLLRPVPDEHWHFELDRSRSMAFPLHRAATWIVLSKLRGRFARRASR
jgi:hypothetical protein